MSFLNADHPGLAGAADTCPECGRRVVVPGSVRPPRGGGGPDERPKSKGDTKEPGTLWMVLRTVLLILYLPVAGLIALGIIFLAINLVTSLLEYHDMLNCPAVRERDELVISAEEATVTQPSESPDKAGAVAARLKHLHPLTAMKTPRFWPRCRVRFELDGRQHTGEIKYEHIGRVLPSSFTEFLSNTPRGQDCVGNLKSFFTWVAWVLKVYLVLLPIGLVLWVLNSLFGAKGYSSAEGPELYRWTYMQKWVRGKLTRHNWVTGRTKEEDFFP